MYVVSLLKVDGCSNKMTNPMVTNDLSVALNYMETIFEKELELMKKECNELSEYRVNDSFDIIEIPDNCSAYKSCCYMEGSNINSFRQVTVMVFNH